MNGVYESHLNFFISKGTVFVGDNIPGWSESAKRCSSITNHDNSLYTIRNWHIDFYANSVQNCSDHGLSNENCPTYDNHGLWGLLQGCNEEGGTAFISKTCSAEFSLLYPLFCEASPLNFFSQKQSAWNVWQASYLEEAFGRDATWLTVVHEIGHSLGGYHKAGGGILYTYLNYEQLEYYNGIYQFHPYNKDEFCKEIYDSFLSKPPEGVANCWFTKDKDIFNYRWRQNGEYGDCFPICGDFRQKTFC